MQIVGDWGIRVKKENLLDPWMKLEVKVMSLLHVACERRLADTRSARKSFNLLTKASNNGVI